MENFNVNETEEFDVSDVEENTLSILSRYVDDADFEESVLNKDDIKKLMSEIYMEACEVWRMSRMYWHISEGVPSMSIPLAAVKAHLVS